MTFKNIRRSLGALAVLALGASLGNASTLYLPAQVFAFGPISASGNATIYFDKFDQSLYSTPTMLAILTSVEIDLNTTSTGSVAIVNANPGSVTFSSAYTQLPLTISSTGISYGDLAKVDICGVFTTTNPGSCVNTPGGGVGGTALPVGSAGLDSFGALPQAANTVSGVSGSNSAAGFVNPADYTVYENFGPSLGTVSVDVTAGLTSSSGTGPGFMLWGGTAQTSGDVSIIYGYQLVSIPEPMTMGLMGSALIGLAIAVRRKHSRKA